AASRSASSAPLSSVPHLLSSASYGHRRGRPTLPAPAHSPPTGSPQAPAAEKGRPAAAPPASGPCLPSALHTDWRKSCPLPVDGRQPPPGVLSAHTPAPLAHSLPLPGTEADIWQPHPP